MDGPEQQPRGEAENLHLPNWVSARSGTSGMDAEDLAFHAAGALGSLHILAMDRRADVPMPLVRDRLAMRAALGSLAMLGRSGQDADLREEVYALRPGESPGPNGAVLARWRRVVGTPLRGRKLSEIVGSGHMPVSTDPRGGTPLHRAADMLVQARDADPRDIVAAVALADACLSRDLGWPFVIPLLGMGLRRADLASAAEPSPAACARAILVSARIALSEAAEAARSRARLMSVARKLRAKASDAALPVFLSQAVVVPATDLSPRVRGTSVAMSNSAARRFCERLVSLGVAKELTGRSWLRMYGL